MLISVNGFFLTPGVKKRGCQSRIFRARFPVVKTPLALTNHRPSTDLREYGQRVFFRKASEEALETQRHDFQMELERVNGRLDQIEARPTTFVNEITVSKAQKTAATQHSAQDTTKTQDTPRTPMVPPSTKPTEGSKIVKPIQKAMLKSLPQVRLKGQRKKPGQKSSAKIRSAKILCQTRQN